MEEYRSEVRVPGEAGAVSASVAVSGRHLIVTAGALEIGDWDLDEVALDFRDDEWHLQADGEQLVLSVAPAARFAEAIRKAGGSQPAQTSDSLLRTAVQKLASFAATRSRRSRLILAGALAWSVALAVVPALAIGSAVLAGSLLLVVGLYATLDPFIAVRVRVPPVVLIGAGGALLMVILVAAMLT